MPNARVKALLCATALLLALPAASQAYCIERVLPESTVYYYDAEETDWAGYCSRNLSDCTEDCVGDITSYFRQSTNAIVCTDCSRGGGWGASSGLELSAFLEKLAND